MSDTSDSTSPATPPETPATVVPIVSDPIAAPLKIEFDPGWIDRGGNVDGETR